MLTLLPTLGTLTLNTGSGAATAPLNQLITKAELDAGDLVFTPAANATGAKYASFGLGVVDTGSTAHGGTNTSSAATATISIIKPTNQLALAANSNAKPSTTTSSNGVTATYSYNTDGAYQIAYTGAPGTIDRQPYATYVVDYSAANVKQSAAYYNSSDQVVAQVSYTNGGSPVITLGDYDGAATADPDEVIAVTDVAETPTPATTAGGSARGCPTCCPDRADGGDRRRWAASRRCAALRSSRSRSAGDHRARARPDAVERRTRGSVLPRRRRPASRGHGQDDRQPEAKRRPGDFRSADGSLRAH